MNPLPWGGANTEFDIEDADAGEVAEMFKKAPPETFFDTATSSNRTVYADGQEFDLNPMGKIAGRDAKLIHDRIERWESGDGDGSDIQGVLSGTFKGRTRVDNDQVGTNRVRTREVNTIIRPDLTKVPVLGTMQQIAESVPLMGVFPRGARYVAETMIGKGLETMHVLSAGNSADDIERTLNYHQRTGKWPDGKKR